MTEHDRDLTDSVKCARKVERVHGLGAWVAWRKYCQDVTSYKSKVRQCLKDL